MALKISVVTATLNRKDYLPRCIEGVASQSYPHKEHVIIDGGSNDGAVELLKTYAETYPHIKWISEPDNGISSALNKGLAIATGDIFGVNGDDDFYEPDAFATVAREFESDPLVGVVSGGCDHIRNDGSVWLSLKAGFTNRGDLIEYWKNWGGSSFLPAPSTFICREVIETVGGFEEADRYAMDYHHWIKITERFSVKTVDKVLAKFRADQGTVSYSQHVKQRAEMHRISKRYWGSKLSLQYYERALSWFMTDKWWPLIRRGKESFKYRAGQFVNRQSA